VNQFHRDEGNYAPTPTPLSREEAKVVNQTYLMLVRQKRLLAQQVTGESKPVEQAQAIAAQALHNLHAGRIGTATLLLEQAVFLLASRDEKV